MTWHVSQGATIPGPVLMGVFEGFAQGLCTSRSQERVYITSLIPYASQVDQMGSSQSYPTTRNTSSKKERKKAGKAGKKDQEGGNLKRVLQDHQIRLAQTIPRASCKAFPLPTQ
eukprot:365904-Chlamydomonas_euryale.AAC.2